MPSMSANDLRADTRYKNSVVLLQTLWREGFIAPDRMNEFFAFSTQTLRELRAQRPAWMNAVERKKNVED